MSLHARYLKIDLGQDGKPSRVERLTCARCCYVWPPLEFSSLQDDVPTRCPQCREFVNFAKTVGHVLWVREKYGERVPVVLTGVVGVEERALPNGLSIYTYILALDTPTGRFRSKALEPMAECVTCSPIFASYRNKRVRVEGLDSAKEGWRVVVSKIDLVD